MLNFKPGDRVRPRNGIPFSNGADVVTVRKIDEDGDVWFEDPNSWLHPNELFHDLKPGDHTNMGKVVGVDYQIGMADIEGRGLIDVADLEPVRNQDKNGYPLHPGDLIQLPDGITTVIDKIDEGVIQYGGYWRVNAFDVVKLHPTVGAINLDQIANPVQDLIEENARLKARIAELEAPTWPTVGEAYWFISSTGHVLSETHTNSEWDREVIEFGNVFHTEEEAQNHLRKLKALAKVNHG